MCSNQRPGKLQTQDIAALSHRKVEIADCGAGFEELPDNRGIDIASKFWRCNSNFGVATFPRIGTFSEGECAHLHRQNQEYC